MSLQNNRSDHTFTNSNGPGQALIYIPSFSILINIPIFEMKELRVRGGKNLVSLSACLGPSPVADWLACTPSPTMGQLESPAEAKCPGPGEEHDRHQTPCEAGAHLRARA